MENFMFVGKTYLKCMPCGVDRKGGLTEIQRRATYTKHRKNMTSYPIKEKFEFTLSGQEKNIATQVKKNEIRIAMYKTEHHLPIAAAGFGLRRVR